jgi:two-component system, cell cycle sensor histidine kinase and response regulator CckA
VSSPGDTPFGADHQERQLAPYPMPTIEPGMGLGADRLVLSALPEAVLLLDPLGIVREANPAAERLLGRNGDQLRNIPIDRLVTLPGGEGAVATTLRTARPAGPLRWSGCLVQVADGREVAGEVVLAPLTGPGAPGRWIVTLQESGRREFEALQRRESAKMAAVATLAAGIANDFNNALTAINGSIEAARLRIVSQDRAPPRELLEAKEATRGAARLVRRLLNFARPATGVRRPLDPGEVVEEAAQVLRRDLDARITLVVRTDHADWRFSGDTEQLTDLLVSLGRNAIEAMPGGGVVTLATSRIVGGAGAPRVVAGLDFVRIEVRDTGVGIPAETLPRIFEPFFTTKEAGRGAGLGLATAYAILQQHGGGITVESALGAGSSFQIFLPRTAEEPERSSTVPGTEPSRGSGTILLVDDEGAVRRPLRQALGICGYSVVEARDGLEALRIHEQPDTWIDLVVLDIKMPGMSGWDVLAELRRRSPRLPVILTSGYAQEDTPPADPATVPDAFLPKPYELAELTDLVRRLLAGRHAAPDT